MNIVKVGGECDISVLFMGNIRFHRPEPHRTPFDVYTKYFLVNISLFANERSHVSVEVEPLSTSRVISTLYIFPLFYLRD